VLCPPDAVAAATASGAGREEEGDSNFTAFSHDAQDYAVSAELGSPAAPDAHTQHALAVVAVAARQLMGEEGPQNWRAGNVTDKIQAVPLDRWDLDLAEWLQRDSLTHSAQVQHMHPSPSIIAYQDFKRAYLYPLGPLCNH
jgi:hypothetical protein